MAKSWANFEDRVRDLASYIWGHECVPIHVGGVDVDGAIDIDTDMRIFIEMTERKDLAKVREDIVKLQKQRSSKRPVPLPAAIAL